MNRYVFKATTDEQFQKMIAMFRSADIKPKVISEKLLFLAVELDGIEITEDAVASPVDTTCRGCGRHELHKMCPAWGTPKYGTGELFTEEDEKYNGETRFEP